MASDECDKCLVAFPRARPQGGCYRDIQNIKHINSINTQTCTHIYIPIGIYVCV